MCERLGGFLMSEKGGVEFCKELLLTIKILLSRIFLLFCSKNRMKLNTYLL